MKKFFSKVFVITLFTLMCMPVFVLGQAGGSGGAAGGGAGGTGGAVPPTTNTTQNAITWKVTSPFKQGIGGDISSIIKVIMQNIVMPLASILVVLAILYSGFKFVVAQGKPKEIEDARTGLIWVLIGSLILLGAYGISAALEDTIKQIVPIQ